MTKPNKQAHFDVFQEIVNQLIISQDKILLTKQVIPWAGARVGPTYAVTTDAVGYELEQLQRRIADILRNYTIKHRNDD